jgi:hypothetical protein
MDEQPTEGVQTCLPTRLAAYAARCVRIDVDLDAEFRRVAGDLHYWAAEAAAAEEQVYLAKTAAARSYADAVLRARSRLESEARKPTEKILDAEAEADEAVAYEQSRYAAALRRRSELRGLVDAIIAKRDMLISLGATERAQMTMDPTIRDR